jgi:pimeloyl-ACP methyl ester carboxylesterase
MLRRQLAEIRKRYPGLKDAVVIGHSMGGMISRLLITDSGMNLWDTYFAKPPAAIPFSPKTREVMAGSLIFKPTPGIGRVVFVAASHRGSGKAVDFWGRVGAAVVGNPLSQDTVYKEAISYARPEAQARNRNRLPNSIDMLDPENLFVSTVNQLPLKPGVPYHSIIGDRGRGGFLDRTRPNSSDSIVPYWSSHLEGASSERVIPSGHWAHLHPLGMVEINRILLEHLRR